MAKARVKSAAEHAEAVVYARGYAAGRADAEIENAALRAELAAANARAQELWDDRRQILQDCGAEQFDLIKERDALRAAVIEECARECDKWEEGTQTLRRPRTSLEIAAAIRALAKEGDDGTAT